jgi:hypothetical protein
MAGRNIISKRWSASSRYATGWGIQLAENPFSISLPSILFYY